MIKKKKILIFIETDVVVRHFIFSNAFHDLNKSHDVVYVFPDGDKRLGNSLDNIDIEGSRRLKLLPKRERLKLWRLRFFVEKLRKKNGVPKHVLKQWRENFTKGNPLYAKYIYLFFGLPFVFPFFTFIVNLLIKKLPNIELIRILKNEKPDLLIHPSVLQGSYIDDVIFYGNKIKKPVIVIMNSWDNPLTKRSVVNKNYYLLVWGKQTKLHAINYMGLDSSRVIEFGAAQFDLYNSHNKLKPFNSDDKNKNKNVKILLYAGSSKFADEFEHLLKIDEAIKVGNLPKIKVIYRPHPWGKCGHKGYRFKNHTFENIVFDTNMKNYIFRDFTKDNLKLLPNLENTKKLLLNVDFVLSPLSTILLEAMILGKIPICLMPEDEIQAEHFHMVKKSPHFEEILQNKEVVVINGSEFLIDGIKKSYEDSMKVDKSNILKKDSEFFISKFSKPFKERLLDFVEELNH